MSGTNFESYALSLFMTLSLLYLAHVAGKHTRQVYSVYQDKVYFSSIFVIATILVLLAFCVSALTIGRAFYSTAAAGPVAQDIFGEMVKQIQTMGLWFAFKSALNDKAAFFLACMNTAGLAVAFFASFIRHDSDRTYQSALDAFELADRALSRMERKYDAAVGRVAKKFSAPLSNVAAAYGAQNAQVVASKRNRNAPLTDDDKVDLSKLDYLLMEARGEIARVRAIDFGGMRSSDNGSKAGDDPQVAQFVVKERRS